MNDWRCVGQNERIGFEHELQPDALMDELDDYRHVFGKDFSLADLLKIYDIRAKMRIAANILDVPEQLCHELALAEQDDHGIASAIRSITERNVLD